MKPTCLLALALASLAACAPLPPTAAEPLSPPLPTLMDPVGCDALKARYASRQPISDPLLEEARQRAGARTARALYAGQAITREYDRQRLNLVLDAAEKVVHVYCG